MKLLKGLFRQSWLLLTIVLFIAVSISPACWAKKVELTMFIWAGANQGVVPKEVVKEYLKTHPDVKINFYESNNSTTYPKMLAAKKTTPDSPLVHFGFFNIDASNKGDIDDMWAGLDPKKIPNMSLTDKSLWRKGNKGISYGVTPIGLIYNKKLLKEPPSSWSDLWSAKFKGKVVLWDYTWFAPIMAARLNGGSETNMDPGFQLWKENTKQIHSLVTSNDQLKNLIVSGDAWVAPWFAAIYKTWASEDSPVGFGVPKEGMISFPIFLQIVAGCSPEQQKVAEEILNLLLTPAVNGRYNELTNAIPTVKGATVSKEVMADPIFSPDALKNIIHLDWKTISENNSEWKERWDKEVKANL